MPMPPKITQEEREKAADSVVSETRAACEAAGHTIESLLKDLKTERKWRITKTIKLKGFVSRLPRGYRVIATSGRIVQDDQGNDVAGDGETVIQWYEKDGGIRQRARMDAHKLRGDYAPEKVDHSGVLTLHPTLSDDDRALLLQGLEAWTDKLMEGHCAGIRASHKPSD